MSEEGVAHHIVSCGCFRRPPIIPRRRRVRETGTSAIRVVPIAVRDAGNVEVGPFGGHVAVVVFQVVDSPGGEGRGVEEFVAYFGRVAGTCLGPCGSIDADFQSEGVDSGGQGRYSRGEFQGVGD